jgi:hypothetical protein
MGHRDFRDACNKRRDMVIINLFFGLFFLLIPYNVAAGYLSPKMKGEEYHTPFKWEYSSIIFLISVPLAVGARCSPAVTRAILFSVSQLLSIALYESPSSILQADTFQRSHEHLSAKEFRIDQEAQSRAESVADHTSSEHVSPVSKLFIH